MIHQKWKSYPKNLVTQTLVEWLRQIWKEKNHADGLRPDGRRDELWQSEKNRATR